MSYDRAEFDDTESEPWTQKRRGFRMDGTFVMQILVWIIAAAATYSAITARVSVLESKQSDADRRLMRIEDKLDRLIDRQ